MPKKPDQESFYEVHLNKQNEVMISIHARDGEPSSPVLIYDGGPHALLYRTPQQTILLDFLHPEVRSFLKEAKQVLIAEAENFRVVREYEAACKNVTNLPLDGRGVMPLMEKEDAERVDERHLYE